MSNRRNIPFYLLASILLCLELFQPFASSLKSYRETCSADNSCESGYCNPIKKECDCRSIPDKMKGMPDKQFYDFDLKLCLSKVDQLCTLQSDGLDALTCTPNADCAPKRNQAQSTAFVGYCSCKAGYQRSDDLKRCISNSEIQPPKVSSMDQVRPEGWNKSGSGSIQSGFFLCILSLFHLFHFR